MIILFRNKIININYNNSNNKKNIINKRNMNMNKKRLINTKNNEPGENFILDNDIHQYEEKDNINKN